MEVVAIKEAVTWLEKSNVDLKPELLSADAARDLLAEYARAEKLASFGKTVLARKVDDASELARVTGTSIGKAKETVATARILGDSDRLSDALKHGDISLDQATEIAGAEGSRPGAAKELLPVAKKEAFHVLKDRARQVKLEAEQHHGLADRQHGARFGRHYSDELGMVHVHLALEPHIGTPIMARAEAEAARLARSARADGAQERFECHLADAYAQSLSGAGRGKGRARRPELVVLVGHEVAKRGWTDVRQGELCKIPGVGPVSPIVKKIAKDAFLNGVFFDGKDLRQFKHWSKHIPVEVATALELGRPPSFDGVLCVDCGNRFHTEFDHVEPRAANGPTSNGNLKPRCWPCHQTKTERDRKAGKLKARKSRDPPGRD